MIKGTKEKGKKEMNKLIPTALFLGLLLGISAILAPLTLASPICKRPMDLYAIAEQGDAPQTVDYSRAFDTASCEIIQNTMDTLLMWNTESTNPPYIFALAMSESDHAVSITTNDYIGNNVFNFENDRQPGPYAKYYYQYDFKIRQGVEFQPPYNYSLTPADVAYSFQRTLLQDSASGPGYLLEEPLLDSFGGLNNLGNLNIVAQINEIGALVRDAVRYNATDVWFNLMYPGAYASFLPNMCQTWAAIESKQWINNQVINGQDVNGNPIQAGRKDWSGDFTNLTAWINTWNPATSPLDTPTPMEYGSGPYILTPGTPDYTSNYWAGTRNVNWWGGWPCFYPVEAGVGPAGYVNTIEVSWNYAWTAALGYFLAGDCDFVALPSLAVQGGLYTNGYTGSYYPYPSSSTNLPLPGIRAYAPLPLGRSEPLGWHFEYDWVNGWYYNPNYPGHNFFNEWKYYYAPESLQSSQLQPYSEYLPADVNHDGVVDMRDIAAIVRTFGSTYTTPLQPNWVFVTDLTNDRTVNMKDIAFVVRAFGDRSLIGTWGPLVSITPIQTGDAPFYAGGSATFTATLPQRYGNPLNRVIQWYYGTLVTTGSQQNSAPTLVTSGVTSTAYSSTWTWTNVPAGSSYVYCSVTDTYTGSILTARLTAGFNLNPVTVESMHASIYAQ